MNVMTEQEIHNILSLIPKEGIIDVTEFGFKYKYNGKNCYVEGSLETISIEYISKVMGESDYSNNSWMKFFKYIKEYHFNKQLDELLNV